MENIQLEIDSRGIALAIFDMPGRPFNVFSEAMMADLSSLIDTVESSGDKIKGLVITSGKSAFVAGADLAMIQDFGAMRFSANKTEMRQRYSYLGALFRRLERLPVPVVAAVNGLALGGGLEVAMACHARVCVESTAPILGLPEILLGLLPGAGGTQRLPRYIGIKEAIKMLLDGNAISPVKGFELGLVDALTDADSLVDRAKDLAASMVAGAKWDKPDFAVSAEDREFIEALGAEREMLALTAWNQQHADLYPAVGAIMSCVKDGFLLDIDAGSDVEWDIFVDLMSDPIASNMVTSCFLNKTAASKHAKRRAGVEAELPKAVSWLSAVEAPARLKKRVELVEESAADLVFADQQGSFADKTVVLRNAAKGDLLAGTGAEIHFCGELSEFVELLGPAADKTRAAALSLLATLGISAVLVDGPRGSLQAMTTALAEYIEKTALNAEQLSRAASSVELAASLIAMGIDVDSHTGNTGVEDRSHGLNMLAVVGLAALKALEARFADSLSSHVDAIEGADLLAIYALNYPKWTGGPLSFLAMLQRKEIDPALLSDELQSAVANLQWRLKDERGYCALALSN
ncbi:MAG: 3-hydroxyacyl-CoA dehydrogenase/enoyl-CoA hydratase/3-hydroxybutyryl-CoA epimerase [Zhongshania marina]|jgi:3-hydroxyacyl-CoA dehydrogenase/enoyl-CoA hydratase/3-hydroxybutyryl-CoA epimerase